MGFVILFSIACVVFTVLVIQWGIRKGWDGPLFIVSVIGLIWAWMMVLLLGDMIIFDGNIMLSAMDALMKT